MGWISVPCVADGTRPVGQAHQSAGDAVSLAEPHVPCPYRCRSFRPLHALRRWVDQRLDSRVGTVAGAQMDREPIWDPHPWHPASFSEQLRNSWIGFKNKTSELNVPRQRWAARHMALQD